MSRPHLGSPTLSISDAATCSAASTGPLPKSDSVQSLCLMNCAPSSTPCPTLGHATIRGLDADGCTHTAKVNHETHDVALSGLGLVTVSLGALASPLSANLRELSLVANALDTIDLGPLSWCSNLVFLTLNSNRLSTIDLSPISSCKNLERLWIHDNQLQSVDLKPLSDCQNLRSLYLEDNSIHKETLDLTPLQSVPTLRSLRLGGNRLGGELCLTPLLNGPSLSVFNVDTSVSLVADADPVQARSSPGLRRFLADIKFNSLELRPSPSDSRGSFTTPFRPSKRVTTPPVSPKARQNEHPASPPRLRRKMSLERQNGAHPSTDPPAPLHSEDKPSQPAPPAQSPNEEDTHQPTEPIVKVLLVGFRRLARYAAEDSFARCGKVMIRASDQSVATQDPSLLLDSHLVLVYSPSEKTLRQITIVVGRIPTVVIGTQRYRSSVDNKLFELLERFNFYTDPMDDTDTKLIYVSGRRYASGELPSTTSSSNRDVTPKASANAAQVDGRVDTEDTSTENVPHVMRKSYSESTIRSSACDNVNIELEDIEDDDDGCMTGQFHRSRSVDRMLNKASNADNGDTTGWAEINRRLSERKSKRASQGWGGYSAHDLTVHGRNKLRAERAGVEASFHDLGGYATIENCASISRSCGLPKCAGPLLFCAAFGSIFEIEATTPEAGIPNTPIERKKRISCEAFLAYWESRLKEFDGEQRLANLLQDNHFTRVDSSGGGDGVGHSKFGARGVCATKQDNENCSEKLFEGRKSYSTSRFGNGVGDNNKSTANMAADLWCPCDAGVEDLIRAFMEGRSSRFGSYALVKMSEAIAIGSSLVLYGIRATNKNRVGGRARAVCPKEVKDGKLNAALVAAEAGIFEGVASGLSMNQIRSVKGCFATEVSPSAIQRGAGCALSCSMTMKEVQQFCLSRKTLIPGAVEHLMRSHCRDMNGMSLSEFSILLSVLSDVSSDGALDYFFTIVDVDQNERWTLADLRQFHMEKEKMWHDNGMALSDLMDLWVNMTDMIGSNMYGGSSQLVLRGLSRKEMFKLGAKERKVVLQSLLFVDDDYCSLNVRRTMEMNKDSKTQVVVM